MTKADQAELDQAEFVIRQIVDMMLIAVKAAGNCGTPAIPLYKSFIKKLGVSLETVSTATEILIARDEALVLYTDRGYCLYPLK